MSYEQILTELSQTKTRLIAVSKTKSDDAIMELYHKGQRDFGENKVQEMLGKCERLPKDIRWHLIGHLQTNKVKYIAPFVHMIHSVDSLKLYKEVQKQAQKCDRQIPVLLQVKIAQEDSKFGIADNEVLSFVESVLEGDWQNVTLAGLMGMATFTDDTAQIASEFQMLQRRFQTLKAGILKENNAFTEISMGMSADYAIACENGSTMVRIGSLLFGSRIYL